DALSNTNTLIITVASLAILLAIVAVAILLIKRRKKQSQVNGFSSYTSMKLSTKRHLAPRLAGLFVLIFVTVFGFLAFNNKHMTNNVEALGDDTLTVTTENITSIDIEMEDEAVFGVGESKVTVTTATDKGYTLMAYVDGDDTKLINDSDDLAINMLETTYSQALTDNTWGIALTEPTSQEETIFRGLPTAEKDAMVVKVSGSSATEANDETTLYYGAYVTPDLEYGHYTGVTINYIAVPNVIGDDITVNYHGNGHYFDEADTKEVNTVTYGQSCEIAYVGGKCRKVYTTEQPHTIAKTSNLNDDGTQNGPYSPIYYDDDTDREILSLDQVVTIPGADGIRVEIKYGLSGDNSSDYIYVYKGSVDWNGDYWPDEYEELYVGYNAAGAETYEFDGDTITIFLESWDEPVEDYDYGVYAKIYPLYNTEPEGIETTETTVCNFVKSENLDDEGNQIEPHPYEMYYEDYDEWGNYRNYQTITIPGAKQIKVVVDYALTAAYVGIAEGYYESYGRVEYIEPENWDDIPTVAGTSEFTFGGSTLTFMMTAYEEPIEDYDYGFYARLYPYYGEELEGSTPDISCPVVRKDGEYSIPTGYDQYYSEARWYFVYDLGDGVLRPYDFYGEENAIALIQQYYNYLASGETDFPISGSTFDAYLYNGYYVDYNANGGSGYMNSQWVLPHTNNNTIYPNYYTRTGYTFIGWNTDPNGYGTWYQPGDRIYDLAQPGETIYLYAQWQLN
ncbi:InlB B-repeat-containing protein, partial [Candidatus Saccharibacteria bacterium]|nr:InlB B-repeat-containing protein [Candidatus Saccharibacteria bacterium]